MKRDDENEGPITRSRGPRASRREASTSSERNAPAGQSTEGFVMDNDTDLALTIESRLKNALCSEEVLKAIVKAVTDSILERVTQQVYAAIKMDTEQSDNKVRDLEKQVSQLKKDLSDINRSMEEQEQYSRRNCLRFHGITEARGEDTDKLVSDVISEHLEIDLSPGDIDRSHRIMPRNKSTNEATKKCIIVKFASYNTRQKVYQARSKLKGTLIFINEDLTNKRQELMFAARKSKAIAWTWSQDGKIFGVTSRDRKKVVIRSLSDIERLG